MADLIRHLILSPRLVILERSNGIHYFLLLAGFAGALAGVFACSFVGAFACSFA